LIPTVLWEAVEEAAEELLEIKRRDLTRAEVVGCGRLAVAEEAE